jgi:hypothetical protein
MPGTSRRKKRNKTNSKLSEHQTILNPLLPKKNTAKLLKLQKGSGRKNFRIK